MVGFARVARTVLVSVGNVLILEKWTVLDEFDPKMTWYPSSEISTVVNFKASVLEKFDMVLHPLKV